MIVHARSMKAHFIELRTYITSQSAPNKYAFFDHSAEDDGVVHRSVRTTLGRHKRLATCAGMRNAIVRTRPWCTLAVMLAAATAVAQAPVRPSADATAPGATRLGLPSIAWEAPVDCPKSAAVVDEMRRLLGSSAGPPTGAEWSARAVVEHDDGWHVTIETLVNGRARRRTLQAETCVGLVDATAWILALMIDPEVTRAPAPPAPSASASPPDPPRAEVTPPPPRDDANPAKSASSVAERPAMNEPISPQRPATPSFWLGPVVAVDTGITPQGGFGLGGALGVDWSGVRVGLSIVDGIGSRTAEVADPAGAFGSFHLVAGELAACPTFVAGRARLSPCASFAVAQIQGSAYGVSRTIPNSTIWMGAGAGFAIGFQMGLHLRAVAGADALVSLSRPRFYVQNVQGDVFRTTFVTGRAWIGPEVLF
jgi:hypothetical protein